MIAVGMHFSWKLHSLLQPQTIIRNRSNQPFLPLKPTEDFSMFKCAHEISHRNRWPSAFSDLPIYVPMDEFINVVHSGM